MLQSKMNRAVPPRLLPVKHKLGGNRAFYVGHEHREKKGEKHKRKDRRKGYGKRKGRWHTNPTCLIKRRRNKGERKRTHLREGVKAAALH